MKLDMKRTYILQKDKLLSIATTNKICVDNSVVCFAFDDKLNLYFGSYTDTLKCRNIYVNPYGAVSIITLQIHGIAKVVPYSSLEYIQN